MQRASCPMLLAAQLLMPIFPYLPHGWVRAWTGLGACLLNRNAWELGIQVLHGPSSLRKYPPPRSQRRKTAASCEGKDDPVAEVPPCRSQEHRLAHTWTDTSIIAVPVPAPFRAGVTEGRDTGLALKELTVVGKVWPACLWGESCTPPPSLPAALGRLMPVLCLGTAAWPGSKALGTEPS